MEDIFAVIREGRLETLREFMVEHPRGMNVQTQEGVWALQEILRRGDFEMARFAVEYTIVNLNLIDRAGNTVLHYGVESGNPELVRYLVERVGCSVVQANRAGETPLDLAQRLGYGRIQSFFEEKLGVKAGQLYHNPVCPGMHPDPSIVRVGEDYYMVHSSFLYFPCIPVSHSRDLIHWEVIGHAITNPSWGRLQGLDGGRGYWAPDISYYGGRFYITATYRLNEGGMPQRLQMVTSSERPEGPYEKPVFLEEDGIDPSIFTDVDQRRYMLLNRGARIFEISPDGREILSEPKLLWYGDCKKATEGPHMLYKDGYYYLFMAEGGTGKGHRVTVARSRELMGVYESCPHNPILRQWDEQGRLQCCGHGMPVETQDGDWYMVYLCNRAGEGGYATLGRETALEPMSWTADGWPVVNQHRGPSDQQKKPVLTGIKESSAGRSKTLGAEQEDAGYNAAEEAGGVPWMPDPENDRWGEWSTIRGFVPGTFSREAGELVINGNGRDLNTSDYCSLLLQHQSAFCFEMGCRVSVARRCTAREETVQGETAQKKAVREGNVREEAAGRENVYEESGQEDWDAGLTCYYDENSYLKLALAKRGGKPGILAAEYVDNGYVTEYFLPIENRHEGNGCAGSGCEESGREEDILTAELKIVTEDLRRSLYYRDGGSWRTAAVFENTSYLSSEGLQKGKRFTGAAAGLYVNGRQRGRFTEFYRKDS